MDIPRATTSRHSRAPSPIHITSAPKRCYNCCYARTLRREITKCRAKTLGAIVI
jgi:hypothetical protein